ncbi:14933_t:CDS:2, partial [Funneliformis caledonium]
NHLEYHNILKPIIKDINELKNGFAMDINNKKISSLCDIISDLPEGNEQSKYYYITILQFNELNNIRIQIECDSLLTKYDI